MPTDLRALVSELNRGTWALGAISLAAERGVLSAIAERPCTLQELATVATLAPATASALADVLAALGLVVVEEGVVRDAGALASMRDPGASKVLAADLRSTLGTVRDAAYAAEAKVAIEGWRAVDLVAVRAQATVSQAITLGLRPILESMPVHASLSAVGARFLDVGAGAAGMGIAYARMYPNLHIVGLEPSETACAEARRAVDEAGFSDRVEIRNVFGQDLHEESVYTAAYVAQMFIPDAALAAVLQATCRALVPGGWLTTGAIAVEGNDLNAATARFRNAIWGGGVRRAPEVVAALEAAGFAPVMAAPAAPGAMVPVIARRPE
jgi:precorrin-6B methylase 2